MSLSNRNAGRVNDPIRVVIVDDNPAVRAMLRLHLDLEDDLVVVGEAVDGFQVVDLAASTDADVVIMDVAMPGLTGIEATRILKNERPSTKVVIYSSRPQHEAAQPSLAAGADAYTEKTVELAELTRLVRAVVTRSSPGGST